HRSPRRLSEGARRVAPGGREHRAVMHRELVDYRRSPISGAPATVLVTGATGFIGRHLVSRLTTLGHRVCSVSRDAGFDILTQELPLDGIEHVFHLAARTGVGEAWRDPAAFLHTNGYGTARVVDQCRRQNCSMTFVSSYLYGDCD